MEEAFQEAVQEHSKVVLSFREQAFISSVGIAILIDLMSQSRHSDTTVRIAQSFGPIPQELRARGTEPARAGLRKPRRGPAGSDSLGYGCTGCRPNSTSSQVRCQ